MDKFFKIKERGSNVKTEIIAGLTTFFAMAYIVFVNPNQVAAEGASGWLVGLGANPVVMGQIWNSVYIAGDYSGDCFYAWTGIWYDGIKGIG